MNGSLPFLSRHLLAAVASLSIASAMAQVSAPPAPAPAQSAAETSATALKPLELQPLVERMIEKADLKGTTVCIYAEDASANTVLADVNGTMPLAPASNNKLVTTAAGLTLLGPDFEFVTRFIAAGPVADGTLNGDLIIYGTGDPSISGRYQTDKMDVTAIMRDWSEKLKAEGITKISGNLVADDSYFDDVYFSKHWYPGERGEYYSAEISALSFNDNCVDIKWNAKGKLPGGAPDYKLNPETDYVDFTSELTVAAMGRSTERYYARGADDNNIRATGTIGVDVEKLDSAAIHDGALFCATVFKDVLSSQGITIEGKPVKTRGAAEKAGDGKLLFEHKSPNLVRICETINLNSQNYFTECVLKALGKIKGGEGSFEAGSKVAMDFCKNSGIYSEGHNAVDGSGLASVNRVTGRQLVDILRYMDNNGLKEQWRGTLPQGAVRGSLKSRFNDTPEDKEVAPRIFGKTGLIGGVRALSGIVIDSKGREVYYSIILNQLKGDDVAKGVKLIDDLALELARSGR